MAQPDDYGFSEEASLLKDSARKFFKNNFPTVWELFDGGNQMLYFGTVIYN